MKHVVLLGGGHAHAYLLRMLIGEPLPDARLTLVTPYDQHTYSGMLPGLVAGHYTVEAVQIDVARARRGGRGRVPARRGLRAGRRRAPRAARRRRIARVRPGLAQPRLAAEYRAGAGQRIACAPGQALRALSRGLERVARAPGAGVALGGAGRCRRGRRRAGDGDRLSSCRIGARGRGDAVLGPPDVRRVTRAPRAHRAGARRRARARAASGGTPRAGRRRRHRRAARDARALRRRDLDRGRGAAALAARRAASPPTTLASCWWTTGCAASRTRRCSRRATARRCATRRTRNRASSPCATRRPRPQPALRCRRAAALRAAAAHARAHQLRRALRDRGLGRPELGRRVGMALERPHRPALDRGFKRRFRL